LDKGYIVAGRTHCFGAGYVDSWVLKLNSDGSVAWQKTYGGSGDEWAMSIRQTSDSGYIVAGSTSFGAGDFAFWVLKLNSYGEIPGCSAIGTSDAIVSDTSAVVRSTDASPIFTSAVPSDTYTSPQDTLAEKSEICVASFVNQALSLDGVDDYVHCGNDESLNLVNEFTLEAWVIPNSAIEDGYIVAKTDDFSAGGYSMYWQGSTDELRIFYGSLSSKGSNAVFTDYGQWVHIAITKDSSNNIVFYRNSVASGTASQAITGNDISFTVGDRTGGGLTVTAFNGQIDEVRIWSVAHTQEEIRATMNVTLQGDEPGLVGYWRFDDGTANDSSPYGNHGMLMEGVDIIPLVGTWPPKKIGDVSGNGTISAYDAALILQYVVGLIDYFPADSIGSPSAIEPNDYEVSLPNVETSAGKKIQLPIAINDVTGLLAGAITLKYNPTILRAIDYVPLKLLNGYYWKANTNLTGEVRFAFTTTEPTLALERSEGKGQGNLLMVEFEVLPNTEGKTSPLILDNVDLSNSLTITKIDGSITVLPSNSILLQNYPNPFNPDTWIPFKLAHNAPVTINIYDTKGQLIRTLHLGDQMAGVYITKDKAAYWDGTDSFGEKVASGVYFYTLQAGEFSATRKMVIVK
jgi:hypothetical protein